jgi:phosphoribosylanthranilate isomerase
MFVQIYEIQTPQEAERCILLGVDRLGSVLLSEEEWKKPEIRELIRLCDGTETRISLIPLFQARDTLYRAMDYYRPHFVHFCESLTDDSGRMVELDPFISIQKEFKEQFPEIDIVRSVPVPEQGKAPQFPMLEIAAMLQPVSDAFLIDTWLGKEPVEGFIGITGRLADRDMVDKLVRWSSIPVILAGGLSPENVYDAMLEIMPAGADSCSQTNGLDDRGRPARFRKDFGKVEAFVREVRRAEAILRGARTDLERKILHLTAELQDRQAALPAHSVRPHQIMVIEDLEEELDLMEKELARYRWVVPLP